MYIGEWPRICLPAYTKMLLFRHDGAEERGDMAPLILKLCSVCRYVVRFRSFPICAYGNLPGHYLNKILRQPSARLKN